MKDTHNTPDVSVIIVNWNTRNLLMECLESFQEDMEQGICEVIVVDNGSSDGSADAVSAGIQGCILLRQQENLGFARGNNVGIRRSKGRYVALVNSDIVAQKNCLKKMIAFMDQNPQVGLAGPKLLNKDRTYQMSCRRFPSLWNYLCMTLNLWKIFPEISWFNGEHMSYFKHDEVKMVDALTGAFMMVQREALDRVGLLDEDYFIYSEEIDWARRFHKAGYLVAFFSESEAIHYGRSSSNQEPSRFYKEWYKSKMTYWEKHHGKYCRKIFVYITYLRQFIKLSKASLFYLIYPGQRTRTSDQIRGCIDVLSWLWCYGTTGSK
ncbi:MAG TPA: glycosyltransferase family 2 protein [Candidatus Deferrimicrobiaceae bacterium]|jgi:hypothetical protein